METPNSLMISPTFGYPGSLRRSVKTPSSPMLFHHLRPNRGNRCRTHNSLENLSNNPMNTNNYELMDIYYEPMDCSPMDLRPIKSCLKQANTPKRHKAVRFCLQN